ncbi:hypothetical protein ACIBQ3_10260 [Streptomyces rubiginosohelvolus]|uniref:hypothetical protein n=1 Tax=Streptomyces rubiginosohelvolus TaxID=67362 RepID=UPI003790B945
MACPACDDARDCAVCAVCAVCADHRTRGEHWRHLIANNGPVLHLQCLRCTHTCSLDTRPGLPHRDGGSSCP